MTREEITDFLRFMKEVNLLNYYKKMMIDTGRLTKSSNNLINFLAPLRTVRDALNVFDYKPFSNLYKTQTSYENYCNAKHIDELYNAIKSFESKTLKVSDTAMVRFIKVDNLEHSKIENYYYGRASFRLILNIFDGGKAERISLTISKASDYYVGDYNHSYNLLDLAQANLEEISENTITEVIEAIKQGEIVRITEKYDKHLERFNDIEVKEDSNDIFQHINYNSLYDMLQSTNTLKGSVWHDNNCYSYYEPTYRVFINH